MSRRAARRAKIEAVSRDLQQQPQATRDSFRNATANLGWGERNQLSGARYTRGNQTRDWQQLAAMYRGSWMVGVAVDCVAEDMVRAGIEITGPIKPQDAEALQGDLRRLLIFERLSETVKWSRLFGGAIAVMLIDGQDTSTPLRLDTVAPGQFKGLLVLDRWRVQPSLTNLVSELGPDLGLPEFYKVNADAPALRGQDIHYSRVVRMTGIDLPYHDAIAEQLWGQSVVERLWDRLISFDSTTVGAAQLVFRAYLRTIKLKGLRANLGGNDIARAAVERHLEFIRAGQSNEGLTVLDAEDDFATQSYTFSGLDSVLIQMGQQLSGALQVPLVRLFGQSPSGLNSSGDSDLRTYYDGIDQKREARLRDPVQTIIDLCYRNRFQKPIPADVGFKFNSLWQMTPEQRSTVAKTLTDTVLAAFESGVISEQVVLRELRQISHMTGVFTNITDEDIEKADADPPDPSEAMPPGVEGEDGGDPSGGAPELDDKLEASKEAGGEPESAESKEPSKLRQEG